MTEDGPGVRPVRSALLVLCLALTGLCLPAAAGARPFVRGQLDVGPELAGAEMVWGESRGGVLRIKGGKPGRGGRTLFTRRTRPRQGVRFKGLAASAQGIIFDLSSRGNLSETPSVYELRAGRLGGRLTSIRGGCISVVLDADGPFVTYQIPEGLCADKGLEGNVLTVRNVLTGATSTVREASEPRIAGRFIAYTRVAGEDVFIDVRDRTTNAPAYSVRIARPAAERDFDVQADGKLALVYREKRGSPRHVIEWYSPAEQQAHRLPVAARTPLVRMVGDRIAFERAVKGGTELVVADLAGKLTSVSRFGGRSRRVGGFDYDGARMAWARRTGKRTRIERKTLRR